VAERTNPQVGVPEIVVGVDGSSTALRAVAWAAAEARCRAVPLRIVHAAPYAVDAETRRRAKAILARAYTVAHRAEPTVPAHTEQLDQPPTPALLAAAEDAGLLVVGMIGERPDEVVIGSVALGLSGTAPCPVAVVRGHHTWASGAAPVLVGVSDPGTGSDPGALDTAALDIAFADAQRHAGPLIVLHSHRGREPVEPALRDALGPWKARYPGVPVDLRLDTRPPAEALLHAAEAARLVVLGNRRRGRTARAVLGSTSRALIRHGPCPVIVVNPDAASAHIRSVPADTTTRPVS
jgi:nucleotide-binding universal stress UspA family protein